MPGKEIDPAAAVLRAIDSDEASGCYCSNYCDVDLDKCRKTKIIEAVRAAGRPGVGEKRVQCPIDKTLGLYDECHECCPPGADKADCTIPTPPAAERGEEWRCPRCGGSGTVLRLPATVNASKPCPDCTPPADLLAVVELKQWLRREMELTRCEHVEASKVRHEIYMALFDILSPRRVRVVEGVWDGYNIMDPNGEHVLAIDRPTAIAPGTPVKVLIEEPEDV